MMTVLGKLWKPDGENLEPIYKNCNKIVEETFIGKFIYRKKFKFRKNLGKFICILKKIYNKFRSVQLPLCRIPMYTQR